MKEICFYFLITMYAGTLSIEREIYLTTDLIIENVKVFDNGEPVSVGARDYQIIYQEDQTVYVDTIRGLTYVRSATTVSREDQALMAELNRINVGFQSVEKIDCRTIHEGLLDCKTYQLSYLQGSPPFSLSKDVEIESCLFATGDKKLDRVLNQQLARVFKQDYAHLIDKAQPNLFTFGKKVIRQYGNADNSKDLNQVLQRVQTKQLPIDTMSTLSFKYQGLNRVDWPTFRKTE